MDSMKRPIIPCPALDHFLATYYVLNQGLIVQATTVRRRLQEMFLGSTVSVGGLAALAAHVDVLGRNTHRLIAALEAGDSLTEIGFENFSHTEATG